jgi:hypothetical protein
MNMSDDLSWMDDAGYDPNMSTERPNLDPIPAGDYEVQVIEAKLNAKDDGNVLLKLVFEVLNGEHTSRRVYENLNVRHNNPQAQEIAQRSYTELWRDAIKLTHRPASTDDMCFKPIMARVGIEKRKDTGELQNRMKRYMPLGGAAPAGKAPVAQQARPAAAQPAANKPSFLRKSV